MSKIATRKVTKKRNRPDLALPPKNYRKALSDINIKLLDEKKAEYEMKLVHSFPAEILHRSKNLREPYDINKRMNECIIEALSLTTRNETDLNSSISYQSFSKYHISSEKSVSKTRSVKQKKIVSKADSLELSFSDKQAIKPIEPIIEYPLYRILNEAVSDLAGLISINVIKRPIRLSRKLSMRLSSKLTTDDQTPLPVHDADSSSGQSQLFPKGFSLYQKGLPSPISKYLANKCTLWKLQSKGRPSLPSSLSVNVTSDVKEDTQGEKLAVEEEDATMMVQPSNQVKLVQVLKNECTAENTIHRIFNKWMLPFRISPKDFPDAHVASVRESKYFLQTLTGSDKVMLNKRTDMVKLNHFLIATYLDKVQRRQQFLRDEETRRLRLLKIQGLVSKNYDESERFSDNIKSTEKPHIAYNSIRPIFNENPLSSTYKTVVKELHTDVVLKDIEEEVASIGAVSFVSSTSSFEQKKFDENDTLASLNLMPLPQEASRRLTPTTGDQSCTKYMGQITSLLNEVNNKDNMRLLYTASENIMNYVRPQNN